MQGEDFTFTNFCQKNLIYQTPALSTKAKGNNSGSQEFYAASAKSMSVVHPSYYLNGEPNTVSEPNRTYYTYCQIYNDKFNQQMIDKGHKK